MTSLTASLTITAGLRRQLTERVKASGEVFTPRHLVRDMLDRVDTSSWFDPNKRWLEPSAGDGNFLVEIKHRLLLVHKEEYILENMLFSVELIDDNHWFLQHRLGYLIDGTPNPILNIDHFTIAEIDSLAQDLNGKNPYEGLEFQGQTLTHTQVLHHRNHLCKSALTMHEADWNFGRTSTELKKLGRTKKIMKPVRDISWNLVNTDAFWPADLSVETKKISMKVMPIDPKIEAMMLKFVEASKSGKTPEARTKFIEGRLKAAGKKIDATIRARIAELVTTS